MEARGISAADPAVVRTMRARVDNCAARMQKRGVLETVVSPGGLRWRLSPS